MQEFSSPKLQDHPYIAFAPVLDPVTENGFLPREPDQLLRAGDFPKIPVVLSLTKDEVSVWFKHFGKKFRWSVQNIYLG